MLPLLIADYAAYHYLTLHRDDPDPNMSLRYARLWTGDPEAYRPAVSCMLDFAASVRRRLKRTP